MNPNVYAKTVVSKVTKPNPPKEVWAGNGAFTVWVVETLGMHWAYTLVFSRIFGLDRLAPSASDE